jgi:4-diphosphocytidyl-2-C-methyl-D-erythritol kinase
MAVILEIAILTLPRKTFQAPAKVNLYLAISGKRPDGYHDLETQMLKLELADLLHLQLNNDGITLDCRDSDLPSDESNLAFRAALAFYEASGVSGGVDMVLEKKVPTAAGLGGGSSDAAAVLRGLNELYDYPLSDQELLELGTLLGADVPFFVADCDAAWATGIGDRLICNQIAVPGWVVLVNPGFAVSTQWVYENFTLTTGGNPFILGRALMIDDQGRVDMDKFTLYNDLEQVTVSRYPDLGQIKEELLADGASGALMSGSGPTVFGLFDTEQDARNSLAKFADRYGKNVFLTKPRSPVN